VLSEQLDLIQQANEELTAKKSNEVDLLSREITQVTMKERESK
jgi:hypothetical protein